MSFELILVLNECLKLIILFINMLNLFKNTKLSQFIASPDKYLRLDEPLQRSRFDQAEREITQWPRYQQTPLLSLTGLARAVNIEEIHYKHEGSRFGLGSFKALGGAYAVLRVIQKNLSSAAGRTVSLKEIREHKFRTKVADITVTSATDGNHGRSVAWGAKLFGVKCRIYIHAEVSEYRAQSMRDLGAEVVRVSGNYDAAVARTREDAKIHNWNIVSDTSWPGYTSIPLDVMAGYGVMAREIVRQLEEPPTHVFLQGGVGALAAAIAASFNQEWLDQAPINVIVEPEFAPCLFVSAKNGKATAFKVEKETMMAGLSCGEPSEIAWPILSSSVKNYLTIPDSLVAPTIRMLANPDNGDSALEAGESAVAGLCGLLCAATQDELRESLELTNQSRVLIIGSEGVTDPHIFKTIMSEKGV